ncbi:type II toxin-antitoxin system VapC family toxin [Pedobacter frigoris]|uniref:type II toxin-antitoxin system VapC family toxin n=1 Tax=Pedobacter frigoris TaxID=2571272 RepID=UPI00397728D6
MAYLLDTHTFLWFPLSFDHTSGVIDLPLHHRDPFDRMIISQAITENLTIISRDQHFPDYPVDVFW